MSDNNVDPLNRACKCERCGEWWYQGTSHRCNPASQLDEAVRDRDRRIAELEAQINDANFVIKELNTRLAEEGRDAVNQKLLEKDYELRATRSGLLERISVLLAENESLKSEVTELAHERDRAIAWLASVGISLSFEIVSAGEKGEVKP
jgi:uncharacterized coiled-coil protein SlyX